MSIIGFPLLLIPLAICNILVFLMPGVGFDAPLARLTLPSGASFAPSIGELLLALGVLLLLLEVIKGARPGAKYVTDHLLSLLVFAGAIAEFLLLPPFGDSTVLLLALLALVDFLSGVALRNRRRPAAAARAAKPGKAAAKELAAEPEVAAEPEPEAATAPEPAVPPTAAGPALPTPHPAAPDSELPQPAPVAAASHAEPAASEAAHGDGAPAGASPQVKSPDLQPDQPTRQATPPAR
ncbi:hypothetical protein [Rhodopseudomonas palustris]|uniref:Transmembrane protein n=1 Tax=Rhodopseudomonas palustris (strain BisB18) TaxID=316056 RepID=Q21C11_RHOPB